MTLFPPNSLYMSANIQIHYVSMLLLYLKKKEYEKHNGAVAATKYIHKLKSL